MDYTRNIKARMVLNDLTQIEISKRLGMGLATFNKKLTRKGTCKFSIDEAIKLAEILGCTLNDLFRTNDVA